MAIVQLCHILCRRKVGLAKSNVGRGLAWQIFARAIEESLLVPLTRLFAAQWALWADCAHYQEEKWACVRSLYNSQFRSGQGRPNESRKGRLRVKIDEGIHFSSFLASLYYIYTF